MENSELLLLSHPTYVQLLGKEQTIKILSLFKDIENGKYRKDEITQWQLKGIQHPVYMRSIRADMQSFVNTFIDPYLTKKEYLDQASVVIDAGGNIGYTALLYTNWWPNAKIYSLEPDHDNYLMTCKNTAAYKGVTVIEAGLWNKEVDLKIEAGQEDGFVVHEIHAAEKVSDMNLTKGVSLPSLMKTYGFKHIDFLKMNIEGSEKEVFSEHSDTWLSVTTAMLIELHDGKNPGCSKAVFEAVNRYPFAVAETAGYGVLFAREDIYRKWYANWYKQNIYQPNINKDRFPDLYLDKLI